MVTSPPTPAIKEFLLANGLYAHDWSGARCEQCDKPCKNKTGVKIHKRFCYHSQCMQQKYFDRKDQQQNFAGTKAEDATKVEKLKEAQSSKPEVQCEGEKLRNVYKFKYLGSIFSASGEQKFDISRRIALAATRCGKLRHCFDAKAISLRTKLRIYLAAVISVLTYGSEA